MIKLDEKYFISADNYGYTLEKNKISIRKEDKEGEWKKGDKYNSSDKIAYTSKIDDICRAYLNAVTMTKVTENNLEDIKTFLKWFEDLKYKITDKFNL